MRKLIALLAAISLLAGCSAVPGGTTPGTTAEPTTEPAVETTEADTREYLYTYGISCYHVPVVKFPEVNAGEMNGKLYDIYHKLLQEMVFDMPQEERFLLGLTYEVGKKDDVVTVTVLQMCDCDLDTYDVYYFSASTGKELTDDAVFAAFDMTQIEGTEMIKKAMEANFSMAEKINGVDDPFFLEQKDKTLSEGNLKLVRPLIAENGELQFVGEFYSLAGADSYWHRFNCKGEHLQMLCREHN